jgi:hypothetical protein
MQMRGNQRPIPALDATFIKPNRTPDNRKKNLSNTVFFLYFFEKELFIFA